MGLSAYNDIIIVSKADDQDAIIGLLQNIFATDPSSHFSFLNIYKELPITSSGTIVEIKQQLVEFATNQTQFAAISEAREVLIQSTFMNTNIIGRVKELDSRRVQVTLGEFSYAEVHADKRNSVRVRLKLPMNVQLAVDGNTVAGVIRDISLGGVCVSTIASDQLERASTIHLLIKLLHRGTGQLVETQIPSRVVRIDKSGVQAQCAMVFNHTAETEQVLSTFIYQRQLEIIKELKEKIF